MSECKVKHEVPRSILDASRKEISIPENLKILEGKVPDGLHGHVFIVAPVGSVEDGYGQGIYRKINKRNQKDNGDGNTFVNGDGMIYRFDFDGSNPVKWMQKIANSPDYKVDKEIEDSSDFKYSKMLKFYNLGLMRFSFLLGLRNQLNTAFMPMKFDGDERLLVTYDAGFPYEINTKTLEVKDPVISQNQWTPAFDKPKYPFPPILSSAHPIFDSKTQEMFTVNYTRSFCNFLTTSFRFVGGLIDGFIDEFIDEFIGLLLGGFIGWLIGGFIGGFVGGFVGGFIGLLLGGFIGGFVGWLLDKFRGGFIGLLLGVSIGGFIGGFVGGFIGWFLGGFIGLLLGGFIGLLLGWLTGDDGDGTQPKPPFAPSDPLINKIQTGEFYLRLIFEVVPAVLCQDNSVYVMKWNGAKLHKYKLVDSNNNPIKICNKSINIQQSMHQIGVTENFLVLADTSFTVGIEQIINNILVTKSLRQLFRIIPSQNNSIYIVDRKQLEDLRDAEEYKEVKAYKVEIPREISHFLVDYSDNDGQKVTLHAAHISAWDIAQWLRKGDKLVPENYEIPDILLGMQIGEMDISLMGRHVIDVSQDQLNQGKPEITSTNLSCNTFFTWASGLYTYNDEQFPGHTPPEKLDKIYWSSLGLWEELTTKFMYDQYFDYEYRTIELNKVLELAKKGIPSCLYKLDAESLTIEDYYKFPRSHIGFSPQFVPHKERTEGSTDGYIVCVVFIPIEEEQNKDKGSQIWIFDAADLKRGPLCKLSHPQLNFGLTLHTAWLKNISDSGSSSRSGDLTHGLCDWIDDWCLSSFSHEDKETLKKKIQEVLKAAC